MNWAAAITYTTEHMGGSPERLNAIMAEDFGQPGDSGGNVDVAAIQQRVQAGRETVKNLQNIKPPKSWTKTRILTELDRIWDHEIGPLDDQFREIGELAGKADGGGVIKPPPPSPPVRAIEPGFTWERHHDGGLSIDHYIGPYDGPHKGVEVYLPIPVTVRRIGIVGPLHYSQVQGTRLLHIGPEAPLDLQWVGPLAECFGLEMLSGPGLTIPQGTTLWTALMTPDQPLYTEAGVVRLFWSTHVRGDFALGRREAGEVVFTCWDSGIEMLADAAHIHWGASSQGYLDQQGNGDVSALALIRALGFHPVIEPTPPGPPGPLAYLQGRARAGRWV